MGISSTSSNPSSNIDSSRPAAPASGKYGGFGSEDMDKFGYNPGKFNNVYDPYTKEVSRPTKAAEEPAKHKDSVKVEEKQEKKTHKKKGKDSDSSDSSSDQDSSSSDEDSDKEEKKKGKKKTEGGDNKTGPMQPPAKADRTISGGSQPV